MSAIGSSSGTAPLGITLGEALLPQSIRDRASAWQRDAILIVAGTALITLGAYISFTVPALQLGQLYVPINEYVPITLQTFGVLFTGALLGTWRGASASGFYLLLGIVGLPVFAADPETGIRPTGIERLASFSDGELVLGSTGGYLLGFIVAAAVVGWLAERGWDRRLGTSIAAMIVGTVVIYVMGVVWLAIAADLSIADALTFGLYPFIPIDIVKLLVAAGLLPLGWRLVSGRASGSRGGSSPTT